MPLVRLEVRNEFAHGAPELYREATREDPKEILEGVAVAGLVGILRQLGDLAEFAAEVFHGLQEEVMITSSRSHKLTANVQRLEAALPPLEKAFLAQRSHLHFAYTAGTNWHAHIRLEQNHYVGSDVPQFIMDSYEVCRDPPCFHLLDRFDPGGSGSCLRRYSDPTFFKRSSVASGLASSEKISKDKKCQNTKKRRLWPRRELSRGASFSYDGGRMQFTQLNVSGNPSPSQTMSTDDVQLRSDLGEQRKLDLRNGSDEVEDDFNSSCVVQSEELESKKTTSYPLMRNDSDYLDYNFIEYKVAGLHDNIQINPSKELGGLTSASAWDEKRDTIDSTVHENDTSGLIQEDGHHRDIELLSTNLSLETVDEVKLETVVVMNLGPSSEDAMVTGDILLDDIESEADQFMDALNYTIEVEPETDIHYTKKKEEEKCSNLVDKGTDDLLELINHNLDNQFSNSEFHVSVGNSFTKDGCEDSPISAAYRTKINAEIDLNSVSQLEKDFQSNAKTEELMSPGSPRKVDFLENGSTADSKIMECPPHPVTSNFRDDYNSGVPPNDGTRSSSETLKHVPETSSAAPVMFWTNGGLLGLQPSKPPDCSLVSNRAHDPSSDKNEKNITGKNLLADLEIKHENAGNSLHRNGSHSVVSSTMASRSPVLVNSKFRDTRVHQEHSLGSSHMLGLNNRLLATGSNGKLLNGVNQNTSPSNYRTARTFDQKNIQSVAYRTFSERAKDLGACGSPVLSPSASPPLQHMKISFQPINGFETSKLKLKFPDGNYNNEGSRDIFPSFQLVPEVSSIRQNDVSDSDDDTFYRSSSSLIDGDCISYQSESNSEQWESGESPSEKDHDMYDAFHRISLSRSVLTVSGNGRKNHEDVPVNCRVQFPFDENGLQTSDHQISYTQSSPVGKEISVFSNSQNLLEPQVAPTPATPPLPPAQWLDLKPFQDTKEPECQMMHKDFKYDDYLEHSANTVSQQPKPAPLNQDKLMETKHLGSHKSNGKRESNQKGMDESDFLHQIRTRSLNLRPTVTTKQTVPSGGNANVQVTAILEKANAVRQAVGSDDGESWSDP